MTALTFSDWGTHVAAYDHRGDYQGCILVEMGSGPCPVAHRIETVARNSVTGRAYHVAVPGRYQTVDDAKHAFARTMTTEG